MKISHVVDSVSRNAGGVFFSVNSLAHALSRCELDISVHGLCDEMSKEDAQAWNPLELHLHRTIGPRGIGFSPSLTRALLGGNDDLLHVHGIWQAQSHSVHRWYRRTRNPYVISLHGMLDPWALSRSRGKKWLASVAFEHAHLRDARCLHALCSEEVDSIRKYGLKNPICLVPNGVALPVETGQGPWVKGPGGERKKILLFLGRLHPKKGLVNALRAWKEVTGHGSQEEWQFVIAGWDQGGHLAELKQLCTELGLSYADTPACDFLTEHEKRGTKHNERVAFTGPVFGEAKDALLQQADAFVLPSFSEGLPMAVLEAWAYRLPVLMTDHCNLPEGFSAGAAVRIGTDTASIAAGMRDLTALPESERLSMGEAGRALVEERFTWDKVAAQMKEVYAWMRGEGEKPGCLV